MSKDKTHFVKEDDKFSTVHIADWRKDSWNNRTPWSVDLGHTRRVLEPIFSPGSTYHFVITQGNPQAAKVIDGKSVRVRDRFPSQEAFEKVYDKGEEDKKRPLRFDSRLVGKYHDILRQCMGGGAYIAYSLVQTKNVHVVDMPVEAAFWPHAHVVKTERSKNTLLKAISGLTGGDVYETLMKREDPQFYRAGELMALHESGVNPIIVTGQHTLEGKIIEQVVDLLMPVTIVEDKSRLGPAIEV